MSENVDPTAFDLTRLRDEGLETVAAAQLVATTSEATTPATPLEKADSPEVMNTPEIPAIILHRGAVIEGVREETAQAA